MGIINPVILLLKKCADAVRRIVGQMINAVIALAHIANPAPLCGKIWRIVVPQRHSDFSQSRKDEIIGRTEAIFERLDVFVTLAYVGLLIFVFVLARDYLSLDALTSIDVVPSPSVPEAVVVQAVWWAALAGSVMLFLALRVPRFRERSDAVGNFCDQITRSYKIMDFVVKNPLIGTLIIILFCTIIACGVLWVFLPYVVQWAETSITYMREAMPLEWREVVATWFFSLVSAWTVFIVLHNISAHKTTTRLLLFVCTSVAIALFTSIACIAAIDLFHTTPLSIFLISLIAMYDVCASMLAFRELGRSWDSTTSMPALQLDNRGSVATIIGITLGIIALKFWIAWEFWLDDALLSSLEDFRWVEILAGENVHATIIFPCTLAGLASSSLAKIKDRAMSLWDITGLTINSAMFISVITYLGYQSIGPVDWQSTWQYIQSSSPI